MVDADVVLVNYRSEELLCECLRLLAADAATAPAGIVVVDNSPERGLAARLPRLACPVLHLAMPGNVGFAAAVNRGLQATTRDCVVLLNPDTRPVPGLLAGLADLLREDRQAAVAAPRLLPFDAGARETPSALWRAPGFLSTLVEYTPLRLLAGGWLRRRQFVDPAAVRGTVSCACVQGACFAISRPWLSRIGPFDAARFFLYWEETDFCRRARAAGARVLYSPGLVCRHRGGASTDNGEQNVDDFWRSLRAYHRKYNGRLGALLRLLLVLGIGAEGLLATAAGFVRRRRDEAHRRYRALLRARWRAQFRREDIPCAR